MHGDISIRDIRMTSEKKIMIVGWTQSYPRDSWGPEDDEKLDAELDQLRVSLKGGNDRPQKQSRRSTIPSKVSPTFQPEASQYASSTFFLFVDIVQSC